ncbi:MAG: S1 RNA-binding domain-containing protein [Candidatus Kapaibacterium sp.]
MTEQENVSTQPQEQNESQQAETPTGEAATETRETVVETETPSEAPAMDVSATEVETTEAATAESAPAEVPAPPAAEATTGEVAEGETTEATSADPAEPTAPTTSPESSIEPTATEAAAPSGDAGESTSTAPEASADATAVSADGTPSGGDGETPEPVVEESGISLEEMRAIWTELEGVKENRTSVPVTVTGVNRGGIVADYNGVEVFIPQSHWTISRSSSGADVLVGETHDVQILELTQFDTDARRVTGTRRSLLRKELLENLTEGARVSGRVSTLTDFGAFVDLGGVDGLLHVSEISYERNKMPGEMLKKGEEVEVIIKKIENGGKRISLSRKELLTSPWQGVAEKFPAESVQKGKVVSITEIGAFIELEPGIDGLVRPRELSWTQRVHSASDILSIGQEISVAVLSVDEEKERMSLSLKRAEANPWPEIVEKFNGDQTWEGEVRELSNKGAVVSVEGVEGFLPRGRMGREANKLTEMKPGDKLTVRVVEIDPKRPSVIFGLPMDGGGGGGRSSGAGGGGREGREGGRNSGRGGGRREDRTAPPAIPSNEMKSAETVGNFSLGDMLAETFKEKFGVQVEQEEPVQEKKSEPQPEAASPASEAPAAEAQPVTESSTEATDDVVVNSEPESVEAAPTSTEVTDAESAQPAAEESAASTSENAEVEESVETTENGTEGTDEGQTQSEN